MKPGMNPKTLLASACLAILLIVAFVVTCMVHAFHS